MLDTLKICGLVLIGVWLYVGMGNALVALVAIFFRLRGKSTWFAAGRYRWQEGVFHPVIVAVLWPLALIIGIPALLLMSWFPITEKVVDWTDEKIEERTKTSRTGSR